MQITINNKTNSAVNVGSVIGKVPANTTKGFELTQGELEAIGPRLESLQAAGLIAYAVEVTQSPMFAQGTYTPTILEFTSDGEPVVQAAWTRVGNMVTVVGTCFGFNHDGVDSQQLLRFAFPDTKGDGTVDEALLNGESRTMLAGSGSAFNPPSNASAAVYIISSEGDLGVGVTLQWYPMGAINYDDLSFTFSYVVS